MQWDSHIEALQKVAKTFYQAYHLTGTIKMKFGVRAIPDSDGDSVVEVYVSPMDSDSASVVSEQDHARHMQLLETMVPPALLGFEFIIHIAPAGPDEVHMDILEAYQGLPKG